MNERVRSVPLRLVQRVPKVLAVGTGLFGLSFLACWFTPALTGWIAPRMKSNTALALTFASVSLLLCSAPDGPRRHRAAQAAAAACALVGVVTLLEYALGINLHVDTLLAQELRPLPEASVHPNRMAPNAAIGFGLLGSAQLLMATGRERAIGAAQVLLVGVFALSCLAIIGYLNGVPFLYQPTPFIRISPWTAFGQLALATGTMFAYPDVGLVRLIVSDTTGGFLVRRLLLVALVVPPLFGGLRLWGQRAGLYDSATGTSLLIIALMLVLGLVIWVSAASLDTVDRHRRALFESESQARSAAEMALRVREEFLSSASHELRTPLQVLKLQLQFLERAHGDAASGPLATGIRKAALQVERLVQLVHRLLDVSILDSARVQLELEELDLSALVEDVLDRLQDQAAPGQLRLRTLGPVMGMWDRLRLEQVLTNLVSNAVKYGRGAPVDVAISASAADVELSVRDRGIGISEEDQRRLFHRFERAVPTRSYAGFGLGLWICRELARAHGGDIRVESTLGEGATFTVRLPRRAAGGVSYPAGTATG